MIITVGKASIKIENRKSVRYYKVGTLTSSFDESYQILTLSNGCEIIGSELLENVTINNIPLTAANVEELIALLFPENACCRGNTIINLKSINGEALEGKGDIPLIENNGTQKNARIYYSEGVEPESGEITNEKQQSDIHIVPSGITMNIKNNYSKNNLSLEARQVLFSLDSRESTEGITNLRLDNLYWDFSYQKDYENQRNEQNLNYSMADGNFSINRYIYTPFNLAKTTLNSSFLDGTFNLIKEINQHDTKDSSFSVNSDLLNGKLNIKNVVSENEDNESSLKIDYNLLKGKFELQKEIKDGGERNSSLSVKKDDLYGEYMFNNKHSDSVGQYVFTFNKGLAGYISLSENYHSSNNDVQSGFKVSRHLEEGITRIERCYSNDKSGKNGSIAVESHSLNGLFKISTSYLEQESGGGVTLILDAEHGNINITTLYTGSDTEGTGKFYYNENEVATVNLIEALEEKIAALEARIEVLES